MRSITKHLFLLLSFITTACSSDDLYQESTTENEINKIEAVVSPFIMDEPNTRTTFWMGNYGEYKDIVWAEGDTIGIYPSKGDQLSFPIVEGVGKTICEFNGGGWALKPSTATNTYTYTAYTPFNRNYYFYKSNNALPVSMIGQKQKGNNNPSHLGAYDLQIAKGTTPTNGKISFAFEHQVAFVRMDIVAPCKAEWKSIELESDAAFTTEAIMNLTLETPTITPKVQTNSVTLELEDVHTNDSLHLVAYMMMLPVDFTDKTLNLTLMDTDDNIYTAPVTIVNANKSFRASYYKWIKANFEPDIPYVTFSANAEQTLTMSEAVETLEYSVNGSEWKELGTNIVTFGGSNGDLWLRGKNENGTIIIGNNTTLYNSPKIIFGNNTFVACNGDIRTLIDYEIYSTVYTGNASFCGLFKDCHNLISAPNLPATTLGKSCYNGMFWGCSSLTKAPELPATILASRCYSYMFSGCSSLTAAPELPATTLAYGCYAAMFNNCTSLSSVPKLPVMAITTECYNHMFSGCSSLTTAPELPATILKDACYQGMFSNCTSLTIAPKLPATTLAWGCYSYMFSGCTSLTTAPELPATTLKDACYQGMFSSCTNLTTTPELPASTLASECYYDMFMNCSSLVSASELPATVLTKSCYSGMFNGCSSLISAPELPAVALTESCYSGMFNGCSNLTSAPILNANILVNGCYAGMFRNCYKLQKITMLATSINYNDYPLLDWVAGVAITGTFIKAKEMESLYIGTYGIPEGWTVVNYEE